MQSHPGEESADIPVNELTNVGDVPLRAAAERVFPRLTEVQIRRVAAHGHMRTVSAGEVLLEQGQHPDLFFLVLSGELDAVRPLEQAEMIVARIGPGQFTGEINILAGRRALFEIRATAAGEVLELDRQSMLTLIQTDAELSEILMRAFILRRVSFLAAGVGDLVLIGSSHSADTLRIKEFLARNGHPYSYLDLDSDPDVQRFMDAFRVEACDIPVLVCRGQVVLRNPTNREIAETLGFNEAVDISRIRDLVVIGSGPSGLAAAVYGASEGLDVLLIETSGPGGQAGSSSRIENYLGFPTGVSGQELASRAFTQAEKFGAEFMIGTVARLRCERQPYALELDDGTQIHTRSVVIASGVQYHTLAVSDLGRFEGAGVYYAATFVERQLCGMDDVIVVGGANSAGQAAVYLAQMAKTVHMLIRSDALAATMSRYLVRRIEETPNIVLHPHTEIFALEGEHHLEAVRWQNNQTKEIEELPIRHVFVMTGGAPNSAWLDGCLARDDKGFVKTGPELTPCRSHQQSLAADAPPIPVRNQPTGRVRSWRCAKR